MLGTFRASSLVTTKGISGGDGPTRSRGAAWRGACAYVDALVRLALRLARRGSKEGCGVASDILQPSPVQSLTMGLGCCCWARRRKRSVERRDGEARWGDRWLAWLAG